MSLVEQIRADSVAARKARTDPIKSSLLITLLGEVVKKGKDEGNRDTTDAEAQSIITKFIKGAKEVVAIATDDRKGIAEAELAILEAYLPKQLTDAELYGVVCEEIAVFGATNLGLVMKALKAKYAGLYDGAKAKAAYEVATTIPVAANDASFTS